MIETFQGDKIRLKKNRHRHGARNFKSRHRLSKILVRENAPARRANPAFSPYYFGARYLDPKYSRWMSCDPAVSEYMSGSEAGGGIYNAINLNVYHYGNNNPLRYTDPTGAFDEATGTIEGGDTLSQIAKDYNDAHGTNTTAEDWAAANGIDDPDKIYEGNHLNAPPSQQTGGGSAGGTAGKSGNDGGFHPPMAMPAEKQSELQPGGMPKAPPGVDIAANVKEARLMNPIQFYNAVRGHGKWDFKQQGGQYADFGNFHYGVVGKAAGFPNFMLKRMAGWAQQQAGTSLPEWGSPFGEFPYGDDPADQMQIMKGINYFNSTYKNNSNGWRFW